MNYNNYSNSFNTNYLNNYHYFESSDDDSDGWILENEIIGLSNDTSPKSTLFEKIRPTSLDQINSKTRPYKKEKLGTHTFNPIKIDSFDLNSLKSTEKASNEGNELPTLNAPDLNRQLILDLPNTPNVTAYDIQEALNSEHEHVLFRPSTYIVNNLQNLTSYKIVLSHPKETLDILLTKTHLRISNSRSNSFQVLRSLYNKLKDSKDNIKPLLCDSIVENCKTLIPNRAVDLIIASSEKDSTFVKSICAKLTEKGEFELAQKIFNDYEKQCSKIFEKGFVSKKISSFVDTAKIVY